MYTNACRAVLDNLIQRGRLCCGTAESYGPLRDFAGVYVLIVW
jgi:hypothetical protein